MQSLFRSHYLSGSYLKVDFFEQAIHWAHRWRVQSSAWLEFFIGERRCSYCTSTNVRSVWCRLMDEFHKDPVVLHGVAFNFLWNYCLFLVGMVYTIQNELDSGYGHPSPHYECTVDNVYYIHAFVWFWIIRIYVSNRHSGEFSLPSKKIKQEWRADVLSLVSSGA